jgi:hypothetical protein
MSHDNLLHEKARGAMQSGELPRRSPDKIYGGPATGALCAVCGASTTRGEVELELEYSGDTPRAYRTHPSCLLIFIRELERLVAEGISCGTTTSE